MREIYIQSANSKASSHMRYDIAAIAQASVDAGIKVSSLESERVQLDLGFEAILVFENAPDDCYCYFKGNFDHTHEDFLFLDQERTRGIEISYLDVIPALACGEVLVAERYEPPYPVQRRLIHRSGDPILQLELGVELHLRRAQLHEAKAKHPNQ